MTENARQSVDIALIDSVAQSSLEGLVGDIAEITLDTMIRDELISAIPIFGTIVKLYNGIVAVHDQIFLRKVHGFLFEMKDIHQEKRTEFIEELTIDSGSREKAGQALVLILDQLNDLEKPALVGTVYRARLEGTISLEEMKRFTSIIDRCFLSDILSLRNASPGVRLDDLAGQQLEALGLASVAGQNMGLIGGIVSGTWYTVNELGVLFAEVVFGFDEEI